MQYERLAGSSVPQRLPIIVAAMTQDELPEVKKENVPSAQPVAGVDGFLQILNAHGISDVRDRYGDRRENWRPFGSAFGTIKEIVTKFLGQPKLGFPLSPDFSHTDEFFDSNPVTCMTSWTMLQEERWCFLIIDGVSLYHPRIQSNVLNALGVMSSDRVTIAVLSPLDATRDVVHSTLLSHIETELKVLEARYKIALDPQAEILACDNYGFLRWLKARMNNTKSDIEREFGPMYPTKRSRMHQLVPTPQSAYEIAEREAYP